MARPSSVDRRNWRVEVVLSLIEDNSSDPAFHLSHAARATKTSVCYLSRVIKAATGHGFVYHVRVARIHNSTCLLSNLALNIKEIAYAVGYASTSDFDRSFKTITGMTPTQYRSLSVKGNVPVAVEI